MNTTFSPGIYRQIFSLLECWPMKFLVLGCIVVVAIPLPSGGESESVFFCLGGKLSSGYLASPLL